MCIVHGAGSVQCAKYLVQDQYNVHGTQCRISTMRFARCTALTVVRCTPFWPEHCNNFQMEAKRKIRRFEDLIVFQKAMSLSREIYQVTSEGKFSKDWGLRDQIRRASVSILSNIVDGFGKYSNSEFKRYLAIANGSSFEIRAQLLLAREIGYLGDLEAEALIMACTDVSKLIGGLRRRIS